MTVTVRISEVSRDRRSKTQLENARAINQERLDQEIEKRWRENVQANVLRRLDKKVMRFLGTPS